MDVSAIVLMYLELGVEHIITGYDHLLFLLALILVASRFMEVLKIVTAFTIAHSITLFLAAVDIIPIYPRLFESIIAATICYVAVENIVRKEMKSRWILTFIFGLIHGVGFASSISEIGFDTAHTVVSILSFNVGIEVGQLVVVALVLPLIIKLKKLQQYRMIMQILSGLIFIAGGYWLVERVFFW